MGLIDDLTAELAGFGYTPQQTFGYSIAQLQQSEVHLVGARRDSILIGVGGVEIQDGGLAELRRFYVQPAARGRGVAGLLLDALILHAQERGVQLLRLETGRHQRSAIAFYRRKGFQEVDRFPPYQTSETSVCMQLNI